MVKISVKRFSSATSWDNRDARGQDLVPNFANSTRSTSSSPTAKTPPALRHHPQDRRKIFRRAGRHHHRDHLWTRRSMELLASEKRFLRPLNYPPARPQAAPFMKSEVQSPIQSPVLIAVLNAQAARSCAAGKSVLSPRRSQTPAPADENHFRGFSRRGTRKKSRSRGCSTAR